MRIYTLLILLGVALGGKAQTSWHNPLNDSVPHVEGRAWNVEIGKTYNRLPARAHDAVRPAVWNLACQSAGLYVRFYTDAAQVEVKYKPTGSLSMPHMPATGVSGLDLYAVDCNGQYRWCRPHYNFGDTVRYAFKELSYHDTHNLGREYCLYLPLYNGVEGLQIGVPADASFRYATLASQRPIVVYGTSIAQGACASRPGMAWTNIIQRALDAPVVNLGFSGNGQLEENMFELLSEIDAEMFVIDCLPNMTEERTGLIKERLANGVALLRSKSDAPILLVEHDGYMGAAASDAERQRFDEPNRLQRAAYDSLSKCVPNLHYLSCEEINMGMDSQVDGIHATDLGMQQYADAYVRKIRSIMPHVADSLAAYKGVRQRREPGVYEWNDRHEAILERGRTAKPEIVMIGNSITHYWGGEPAAKFRSGEEAWNKLFRGRSVLNMGCGWDRIENVVWRIEHGELDGFEAKKICLLLGTNNIGSDSYESISRGVKQVVELIKAHQPKAAIAVCAILPRKNAEEHVAAANKLIHEWVKADASLQWLDAAPELTDKDGRIIPSLFRDGLHPNEKGYERFAKVLRPFIKR